MSIEDPSSIVEDWRETKDSKLIKLSRATAYLLLPVDHPLAKHCISSCLGKVECDDIFTMLCFVNNVANYVNHISQQITLSVNYVSHVRKERH